MRIIGAADLLDEAESVMMEAKKPERHWVNNTIRKRKKPLHRSPNRCSHHHYITGVLKRGSEDEHTTIVSAEDRPKRDAEKG